MGPHDGHLQQVVHRGPLVRVLAEAGLDALLQLGGVLGGDRLVLPAEDAHHKRREVGGVEGVLEGRHLVQHTAKGPDIALVVVRLAVAELRGEVVGSSHRGLGKASWAAQHLGEAKVAELDLHFLRDKDVFCFDVTVEDVLLVEVLQGQEHLGCKVDNLGLREGLLGALNMLEEAAIVGVLHHHVKDAVLDKGAVVARDVGVRHSRQNLDLIHDSLLVLRVGFVHEDALDDILKAVGASADQDDAPLSPPAEATDLLEVLHLAMSHPPCAPTLEPH
mmetsp:Transcript_19813/g.55082  ORF Transcript_19813/g.55082 Transcript_19813/m.55082 type:complete len:276 (+) Transcript_19813:1787-2614(+)